MSAPPRRGEIWQIDFGAPRGSEQAGLRPAIVVQNDVGNRHASTTIVAAITSAIKPYPVTVVVEPGEGGLRRKSMVNLAQILTVDKGRLKRCLGRLGNARMAEVDAAIRVSLEV